MCPLCKSGGLIKFKYRRWAKLFATAKGILVKSLPRKTSNSLAARLRGRGVGTVPQTDTGSQVEKTKANE